MSEERLAAAKGRFWSCVNKLGPMSPIGRCWQWTLKRNRGGYGRFAVGRNKQYSAHRVAFWYERGKWPPCVLHRCDNPGCVRPSHLRAGTQQDNMDDMMSKGRHHRGENTGGVRLTEQDVRNIRASKETIYALAKRYGRGWSTIAKVVYRVTWRHVT